MSRKPNKISNKRRKYIAFTKQARSRRMNFSYEVLNSDKKHSHPKFQFGFIDPTIQDGDKTFIIHDDITSLSGNSKKIINERTGVYVIDPQAKGVFCALDEDIKNEHQENSSLESIKLAIATAAKTNSGSLHIINRDGVWIGRLENNKTASFIVSSEKLAISRAKLLLKSNKIKKIIVHNSDGLVKDTIA